MHRSREERLTTLLHALHFKAISILDNGSKSFLIAFVPFDTDYSFPQTGVIRRFPITGSYGQITLASQLQIRTTAALSATSLGVSYWPGRRNITSLGSNLRTNTTPGSSSSSGTLDTIIMENPLVPDLWLSGLITSKISRSSTTLPNTTKEQQ